MQCVLIMDYGLLQVDSPLPGNALSIATRTFSINASLEPKSAGSIGGWNVIVTSVGLIANQTSLGGVSSSLESRRRWEGDRVPEGLVRLSVGLEPTEELWADLDAALGRTAHGLKS